MPDVINGIDAAIYHMAVAEQRKTIQRAARLRARMARAAAAPRDPDWLVPAAVTDADAYAAARQEWLALDALVVACIPAIGGVIRPREPFDAAEFEARVTDQMAGED